tara:strand:+ start:300 stop:740 length:441 start_codon:yes stop_codon:yes gene_type:complete
MNGKYTDRADKTKMPSSETLKQICQPEERVLGRADDGSVLEFMLQSELGNTYLCRFPSGFISHAAIQLYTEEIWYFIQGEGVFWIEHDGIEKFVPFNAGTALLAPCGGAMQFRNNGQTEALAHVVTMPPWPGSDGAKLTKGPWKSV